jgi:nitrite reductase (NO-forming)
MMSRINRNCLITLAILLACAGLASACAGLPGAAGAANGKPSASYTLKTGLVDGQMAFIGVGGAIDGLANPELAAGPGQIVEITLVNGDGAEHSLDIPGLNVRSEKVSQAGSSTTLRVQLFQAAKYAYSDPGYADEGMQGAILASGKAAAVDQAVEQAASDPAESAGSSAGSDAEPVSAESAAAEPAQATEAPSIVREPTDLPAPVGDRPAQTLQIDLEAIEMEGRLADGTTYTYWTFDGKVPGPFLRVRVGDTVELRLTNREDSMMTHSIDLHAVTGPGGGAAVTQALPGEAKSFTFKALNPGLYVYHCATPMVAHHMANGMYGLILVEPEGGLPEVDREFYVMQGEIYTSGNFGVKGAQTTSIEKLLAETPDYLVFNGAVGALTAEHPLRAQTGETVRIFMGVGGPNLISSFHVIGEIFDRVFDQASLTAPPLTDVQTTLVPPGGATMVEFGLEVPGRYILVDHALSRLEHGLAGYLEVEGPEDPEVFFSEHPADGSH